VDQVAQGGHSFLICFIRCY